MIIDISIIVIAATLVVLSVFVIIALVKSQKTLRSVKRDVHHLSTEAIRLMHKIDALTSDLKSKSEALNFAFRPLKSLNHPHKHSSDTMTEIVDWLATSLILFDKIKAVVKHYAK